MHLRSSFASLSLLLVMLLGCPRSALAQQRYTTTFLPEWLNISAINNAGQMTGVMRVPGGSNAFLYTNGDVRALGGTRSFGHAISNNGMVTGEAASMFGDSRAFLYANGTMRDLGTLPGGSSSIGIAINDAGQVVGSSNNGANQTHAILAANGIMRDLGTLGGTSSYGSGINSAGHVVGASTVGEGDERHAFVYRDGVMSDLGSFGGKDSFAEGINDRDQIIGSMLDAADVAHSFIYANGGVNFLGDFGGRYTDTWGINNLGQVVGYSTYAADNDARRGFLYTDGKLLDINSLIDPALGWKVVTAVGINDAQQIIGYACRTANVCRPVRLDPVTPFPIPEPDSVAMLLTGLAVGALRLGRRRH